jgi:hypothetical protein
MFAAFLQVHPKTGGDIKPLKQAQRRVDGKNADF